ncbi:MAG: hypothetical protein ACT4N8_01890 [Sphingosinicella sp.]
MKRHTATHSEARIAGRMPDPKTGCPKATIGRNRSNGPILRCLAARLI